MAKPNVKRPSRTVKGQSTGIGDEGRGWMNASPMAWVSAGISILSLAGMIWSGVFAYANLNAEVKNIRTEVERNFKEDDKRLDQQAKTIDKNHEFTTKAVERIDTTIGSLGSLNVKIGVLETKLESINDTLKRMEKQLDRSSSGNHTNHKMMTK